MPEGIKLILPRKIYKQEDTIVRDGYGLLRPMKPTVDEEEYFHEIVSEICLLSEREMLQLPVIEKIIKVYNVTWQNVDPKVSPRVSDICAKCPYLQKV